MDIATNNVTKRALFYGAIGLVLLAFVLRLAFLITSTRNVLPTGDEGLLMLQAKSIWQGKEWPLLFWAQPYTFPVESYVNALFSTLLPPNALGARLVFWFWGLASSLLAMFILRRMGAFREVWPAYLMVLFPSAYMLTMQAGYAPPSYPSYMVLFLLAVLFAKISETAESGATLLWVALSGFFAGLVSSVTLLAIPLLLGLAAFYAMRGCFRDSLRQSLVFAVSALVGLAPYFIARLTIPGAYSAVSQYYSLWDALDRIWNLAIAFTLSRTFGLHTPVFPDLSDKTLTVVKEFADVFHIAWLVIFMAVMLLGVYRLFVKTRESGWLKLDFVHIFSIVTMLAIILFALSTRALSHSYRYLLPVVLCFPFQVAYLYRHMNQPLRLVLGSFVVLLSMINIVHSKKLIRFWKTPGFARAYAEVRPLDKVIEILDREGIHYAYGSWFSAHRLSYATDERIISGQYYNERFYDWPTPYRAEVDAQQDVAFVLDWSRGLNPKRFETELARSYPTVSYTKLAAGFYDVYYDFEQLPDFPENEISGIDIKVKSSHNPSLAVAITDQNMQSHWRSIEKQEAGMYLELTLPGKQAISGIKLYYYQDTRLQAQSLNILAEQNGQWVAIKKDIPKNISFFDFKNLHPVVGKQLQRVSFPEITTDKLRIEIAKPAANVEWALWEIKLFSQDKEKG